MKSIVIWLLVLGLTTMSYSQIKTDTNPNEGLMSIENLPGVVIKSAGKDFSVYVPDRNTDATVRKLENKFIAYDLGKNYEGYETYLVLMEIENGSLSATYDENGKLMSVVENYKNIKLPSQVIYSVYKKYPGWKIINDKYLYSQKAGDVTKKQYNLKIKKGKEKRNLVVNANGDILKG